jgi:hypothetical protein
MTDAAHEIKNKARCLPLHTEGTLIMRIIGITLLCLSAFMRSATQQLNNRITAKCAATSNELHETLCRTDPQD